MEGREKVVFMASPGEKGIEAFSWVMEEPLIAAGEGGQSWLWFI